MATDVFFDTNVLLYLLTADTKADQAEALIQPTGVISVQVLNEFVSVARRKHSLDWDDIHEWLSGFRNRFQVQPMTVAVQERAVEICQAHQLNIYDATILAAAEEAGCAVVYSEDMQDGQRIGAMTIRNPFR